jgi:Family of unknown function (DUF5677)
MKHVLYRPPDFDDASISSFVDENREPEAISIWYRFLRDTCVQLSTLPHERVGDGSRLGNAVIRGLLDRIAQLLNSQIVLLAAESHVTETLSVIDRCLHEACVNVIWLCSNSFTDCKEPRIRDFVAESIDKMKSADEAIHARAAFEGRQLSPMEERLVGMRGQLMTNAGLSEMDVRKRTKLPKFEERAVAAGYDKTDAIYIHSLKSDAVHGGWATLHIFHLDFADGEAAFPRNNRTPRDWIEGAFIVLMLLRALKLVAMYLAESAVHEFLVLGFNNCECDVKALVSRSANKQKTGTS